MNSCCCWSLPIRLPWEKSRKKILYRLWWWCRVYTIDQQQQGTLNRLILTGIEWNYWICTVAFVCSQRRCGRLRLMFNLLLLLLLLLLWMMMMMSPEIDLVLSRIISWCTSSNWCKVIICLLMDGCCCWIGTANHSVIGRRRSRRYSVEIVVIRRILMNRTFEVAVDGQEVVSIGSEWWITRHDDETIGTRWTAHKHWSV